MRIGSAHGSATRRRSFAVASRCNFNCRKGFVCNRAKAPVGWGPWALYKWRNDGISATDLPDVSKCFRGGSVKASRPATPCYFAWGCCFRYFSWERAPRRRYGSRTAMRCGSTPPFSKSGRLRLIDFPIEKVIIARPRVDLARANLTPEAAGILVWMLLHRCAVGQPAIGTAKIFGRPYFAFHPAIMRCTRHYVPAQQSATNNDLLPKPLKAAEYWLALS